MAADGYPMRAYLRCEGNNIVHLAHDLGVFMDTGPPLDGPAGHRDAAEYVHFGANVRDDSRQYLLDDAPVLPYSRAAAEGFAPRVAAVAGGG
jgi:hypothetical protein